MYDSSLSSPSLPPDLVRDSQSTVVSPFHLHHSINTFKKIILSSSPILSYRNLIHTTTGCGKQGFPSAQPYLSMVHHAANTQCALSTQAAL
ncbi:hypothetical protein ACN38_g12693 [Penicillium nordicum]|uniref:Uncharacterized protein n=1 Tax=Penicillium nordicum TaxID=229535 RepID=A0A0M9W9N8_9EURO|nr:hypothetical protein ACN38_g12693 [Penicillium nordicum]